ncbi:unknown [Clostridium sp. CAG:253]|nr:unknown [Clostridium sp. CAG:253]
MKISEILKNNKITLSMEGFPPKTGGFSAKDEYSV